MEKILELINTKYPDYFWCDEPCQIETDEMNFCIDIDSALENDENIIDENIKIKKEICFESDER